MGILTPVFEVLAWFGQFSDPLAWTVVATFLAGAVLEYRYPERAKLLIVAAWVLFGVFWLSVVHHFTFVQKSIIESVGTAAAVPACLSVALLLARGRDSLMVLSRSIAVMGIVFLPFEAIPMLRETLIEAVTDQTAFLMSVIGFDPTVIDGLTVEGLNIADKTYPYDSTFLFYHEGDPVTYTIKIACTGLGSMSVMAGLIAAVDAPMHRKLRAFAASIPVIYGLNLVRNVFIGLGLGTQKFHIFPDLVSSLFAIEDEVMVSYYVTDRIIAQSLSVVVMIAITWAVVHQLPELLGVIEDAIYVLTRREVDLGQALGIQSREVRADGEGESPLQE
jgi:archaeosortase A (PGF-CTERM-specific)